MPEVISRILILTDFHRPSYGVLGKLYQTSFDKEIEVIEIATPESSEARSAVYDQFQQCIVLHNTLGDGFVPIERCYNIAIPAHEWSAYPKPWIKKLNQFEEVWTTTDHVMALLQNCGLNVPCYKLPPALDLDEIPSKRSWNVCDTPHFLAVGEPHFRKGHHLLMQGFTKAFPEIGQARLTIKTSPACNWESPRKDITVIKEEWTREKLLAEYAKHDCFISTSLAEGLGLPIAEAIMAELPICTNFWGGHKSLLTPGGFFEIAHEEIIQPFTSNPAFYAEDQKCAYSSPTQVCLAFNKFLKSTLTDRKNKVQFAKKHLLQNYGRSTTHANLHQRIKEINSNFS
jgi:glycosyltransferase involved in cell wall biosynthesis